MKEFNDHILKSIEFRLYEYGYVAIPGLGMLILSEQGAKIDFISDKILPPSREIHFLYSRELEDYILANTIKDIAKEDMATSMSELDQWVSNLHTNVLDGQINPLGNLGEFYLNNGAIEFRQRPDVNFFLSYGLGQVAAKPVRRVVDPMVSEESLSIPVAKKSRKRKRFRFLPWAAAVLILLAVSYLLYDRTLGNGIKPIGDSNPIFYQEDRLNKNPEEVQNRYDNLITEEFNAEDQNADSSISSDLIPTMTSPEEEEGTWTDTFDHSALEEFSEEVESTDPETEEIISDEDFPDRGVDGQHCIVIVGAFSTDRYFNAMQDRVQSHGFEVYVDTFRGLKRVGVITSCDRKNLMDDLQYCREEIESAAWILK